MRGVSALPSSGLDQATFLQALQQRVEQQPFDLALGAREKDWKDRPARTMG
jgi:hypothetical protein